MVQDTFLTFFNIVSFCGFFDILVNFLREYINIII